jgi:hypothetical protein
MSCTRRTLATGDYMLVEQCSCGSVHLTIGAVTLRLATSSIASLAATLDDAARAISHRDRATWTQTRDPEVVS